jgi:hypothetical protein
MTLRPCLALLLCLAAVPAGAQTLQGRAVDRASLQPIPNASLVLVDSAGMGVATARADSTGAFRLTAPGPGAFSILARRLGYADTRTRDVPLQAGESVAVELRMALRAVALDTARVALAASPGIHGRLLDDRTGEPVADARVTLHDARGQRVGRALTSADGAFHLRVPSPDGFTLRAERTGYARTQSAPITVVPDDTVQVELRMATDALVLAPLTVVAASRMVVRDHQMAGFEWRREKAPFGRFVGRDEIRRMNPFHATDVLQRLPLVRVDGGMLDRSVSLPVRGGTFSGSRRCIPNLYVDGIPVRMTADWTIDEIVPGRSIAAVELYHSPAFTPGEFPARQDPFCGVLVIWTEVLGDDR